MSFTARHQRPGSSLRTLKLADRIAYAISCLIVGSLAFVAIVAYASMIVHIRWF